jgi:hypothetical protein
MEKVLADLLDPNGSEGTTLIQRVAEGPPGTSLNALAFYRFSGVWASSMMRSIC